MSRNSQWFYLVFVVQLLWYVRSIMSPTDPIRNSDQNIKSEINQINVWADSVESSSQYWTGFCKAWINEYPLNLLPFVPPHRKVLWTLCDQSAQRAAQWPPRRRRAAIKAWSWGAGVSLVWVLTTARERVWPTMGDTKLCLLLLLSTSALACEYQRSTQVLCAARTNNNYYLNMV